MATKTNWTMNETQKSFIEALGNYADGITLFELELEGKSFKSGSINVLVTKGIVEIVGERDFVCDIVYNGNVIGHVTRTRKVYKLATK